jgi:hypothetical protein
VKYLAASYLRRLTLFLFLCPVVLNAQILRDSSSINLVKKGIDYIYNFKFAEAENICAKLGQSFPDHPVTFLLKGMMIYWQDFPLLINSPKRAAFEENMHKCIDLSSGKHNPDDDAEYLLSNLSARGMLLLFYSDMDLSLDVISLTPSTYQLIRRAFDYTNSYIDFHFFTGLYNYYREAYPEAYPVYKALAFLFPKGDRQKGLDELQKVARNSILFKAESYTFLCGIYLSFEYNFDRAYAYSKSLYELYPSNLEFAGMYIKNLLLVKHYDEAEELMQKYTGNTNNSYFIAQMTIFNGILQEKKYHNYSEAEHLYLEGLQKIALFGHFGNEFAAYGYFGLSRISDLKGDKHYKQTYHKKAYDLADFKKVDFDD